MVAANQVAGGALIFITAGLLAFFLDPTTIDSNQIDHLDTSTIIQAHPSSDIVIENDAPIDEPQYIINDSSPPSLETSNDLIIRISPYFVELCNRTPQFCEFMKDSKNEVTTKIQHFQHFIEPHFNRVADKVTLFLEDGETEFFEELWSEFWNQDPSYIVLETVAAPLVLVLIFELFVAIVDLNLDVFVWITKKVSPAQKVPKKGPLTKAAQSAPTTEIPNTAFGTTISSSPITLQGSDSANLTAELGQEFFVQSAAPTPGLNAGTLDPTPLPPVPTNPKDTAKLQLDTLFAHHRAIFGFVYRIIFWKDSKTSWIAYGATLALALFITWINFTLISLIFLAGFFYITAWWAAEYNSITWSYIFPDPEGDTAAAMELVAYWKAVVDDITVRKQAKQRRAPRQFSKRMIIVWLCIFLLIHFTNRFLLAILLVNTIFFGPKKYIGKKEVMKKQIEALVLGKA